MDTAIFLGLFGVGLAGSPHCIGMCGGIVAALGSGAPRWNLILGYNIGRLLSYCLAGTLAGLAGGFATTYMALGPLLRSLAAIMLILMGLYLSGIWRVLTQLEKAGQILWRHIQPRIVKMGPADSFVQALPLGMLWGWLPCGLVYSALATAVTSGSLASGALAMLFFGLGTLPAMLAGGWFAAQLGRITNAKPVRLGFAALLVLMGSWALWMAQTSPHGSHESMSMEESSSMPAQHQH